MITGMQIRAARAALKWSAQDLADHVGASLRTIQRLELTDEVPPTRASTLQNIQEVFERAGVVFIPENGGGPGVRLKKKIPREKSGE